jgi:hypothetical protein
MLLWVKVYYWEKSRFRVRWEPGGGLCSCLVYLQDGTLFPRAILPLPHCLTLLDCLASGLGPHHVAPGPLLSPWPTAFPLVTSMLSWSAGSSGTAQIEELAPSSCPLLPAHLLLLTEAMKESLCARVASSTTPYPPRLRAEQPRSLGLLFWAD